MPPAPATPVTSETVLLLSFTLPEIRGDSVAEDINREFHAALDRTGAGKVVIDFQTVQYFSSVGFRPLLSLLQRLKASGGRIVLCNLCQVVSEVLQVTRFIDTSGSHSAPFEVQPDKVSAVSSLLSPVGEGMGKQ
jgi:anti-anti-sigma factor